MRQGPFSSQWKGMSGYGFRGDAPNITGPTQNTASRSVMAKSWIIVEWSTAMGLTTSRRPSGSAA